MIVNVDAGEGDAGSSKDLALMQHVDAMNLALGGHAGDPGWTRELACLALDRGLRVHLHPGIPDRENFGRVAPEGMSWAQLVRSLTRQRAILPAVSACKFHGALYNLSTVDREMASKLVEWCLAEGVDELLVFPGGELEAVARGVGLRVVREGFIDRCYRRDGEQGRLVLAARELPGAVLEDVEAALKQARGLIGGKVVGLLEGGEAVVECETLCLHGDGVRALELAERLRREVLG